MEEFNTIESLAKNIKIKLNSNSDKKKVIVIYAFNATGKTRLANELSKINTNRIAVLCYSALLEDMFVWNNEKNILQFDSNSWIIKLVKDQGLENEIITNFRNITRTKVEPLFDFEKGEIGFNLVKGDDAGLNNIKISKGEESIFIWSVFNTVLEMAINTLNDSKINRTTNIFNSLRYIVIDDPVSSIDDTKIISMSISLVESIKSLQNKRVKVLVTTHHPLFFNILMNSFKKENNESYNLSNTGTVFKLVKQNNDSPFSYHLLVKKIIEDAIFTNTLEKYHFNLFRGLLEKTAIFFGYPEWSKCIYDSKSRGEIARLLNLYSHNRISDVESKYLSNEDKIFFEQTFNDFVKKYFYYE